MKLEKQKRMLAILQGEVPIEEITDKELKFLENRVMKAVLAKKAADPTRITFREHRTLQ